MLKEARFELRSPRQGEGRALRALYRATFAPRVPGRVLSPRFSADDTLVVTFRGEIVALGCYEDAGPDLDPLLASLDPVTRALLDPVGELDDPAVVVEAPHGTRVVRRRRDRLFTALAVDPGFRRLGIGRALVLARLELAARERVGQVFAHCVAGSGSLALYRGLGFTPLVRLARHYQDGSGMTLVWREISPG